MHAPRGRTLRKDVFQPSKHLLGAFYKTLPSKNPSKNLVFTENPNRTPSKNPSKKQLLFREPSKNPSKSRVLSHDPLGVHPTERAKAAEKASCGETVVQKCVFGESVSFLHP